MLQRGQRCAVDGRILGYNYSCYKLNYFGEDCERTDFER